MEPPGLLHRHCRVGLGRQVSFFLSLSVVIDGSAWQALDLGELLVLSMPASQQGSLPSCSCPSAALSSLRES